MINFGHHATYHWKALDEQISNIYITRVKSLRFFIYWVLSYFPFSPKGMSTHFRMNITKNSFMELAFSTYTNKFLIKCRLKKTFFRAFLIFRSWDIAIPDGFFFQKITICNFCCSQRLLSCDLSSESSWGLDFKYIYFFGWKSFHFWYTHSYHICLLAKKCVNSFLHEYYQKLILGISFFYIHQQFPY